MGPEQFIVCGGNALAHRLIRELSEKYDAAVTAIFPPNGDAQHVAEITKLLGPDNVVEDGGYLTDEVLIQAGVATAAAIAFVDGSERDAIHAAMRARRLSTRDIRIVVRMFNQRLAQHFENLIGNCAVLSASATAAPAFVNDALERPQSVRVGDRTLRVAIGTEIDMTQSPLLVATNVTAARAADVAMLPEALGLTREWMRLQERPRDHATLQYLAQETHMRPRPGARLAWRLSDALRFFAGAKLRTVLFSAVATVTVSFLGIWVLARPFGWALYETLLDVAGSAVPDVYGQSSAVGGSMQRLFQLAITLSGVLLMPVVTAVFVEGAARRGVRTREPGAATRAHVIVFGLGNAGLRVAMLLHELGVPVVGIDRDPNARGIAVLGALEIPVVAGERPVEEALRRAHIERARAVVALTGDDVSNLELSLEARAVNQHVRIVVRLFDDNFARHITEKLVNTASQSASSQAAPAFAAAMMGRGVLGTLSIGGRTLLVVEVDVTARSRLVGKPLSGLDEAGHTRVLALRRAGDPGYRWHPAERSRPFEPGDVVVVAATRAGLGKLAEPHAGSVSEAAADAGSAAVAAQAVDSAAAAAGAASADPAVDSADQVDQPTDA